MGAMFLVQLLLPLYDNGGQPLARATFDRVRAELVERFGGLTAYSRAPARGLWQEAEDSVVHDDLVVYEVMCEALDRPWWARYRAALEQRLGQRELVVRAQPMERL